MAKFISSKNPISSSSLKRRSRGTIVVHHSSWEDIHFTRTCGGWLRERVDFFGLSPMIVSSADVARECNHAFGCAQSWAKVY